MHVLLVANGFPPTAFGGVEVYTAGLAHALMADGHRVTVMCAEQTLAAPDYSLIEQQVEGVSVFRLVNNYRDIRSFAQTFTDPRIDQVFADLLARIQPDLVHFNHLIKLSARLPRITAERGIPCLVTVHDFWALCQRVYLHDWRKQACPGPQQGGDCYRCVTSGTAAQHARTVAVSTLRRLIPFPIRLRLRRLLTKDDYFLPDLQATPDALEQRFAAFRDALLAARHIIAPSQFVKDTLVRNGYPPEAIVVLPLGLRRPAAISSAGTIHSPVRLAFVGSLLPWKGTETLIRAFKQSHSQNLHLSLYGREDIIPAFSRQLRQLAQDDSRIAFKGPFQPDQGASVYADIDALVIPSMAHESFSLVAREALLHGKPVIASAIGALPEVIFDGINGFLVPPGDAMALAAVFDRIAQDPALLTRFELPGPAPILTIEEHLARLEQLYSAALAR